MTQMSPLRRRMIEDMTVRNLSPAIGVMERHYVRRPDAVLIEAATRTAQTIANALDGRGTPRASN